MLSFRLRQVLQPHAPTVAALAALLLFLSVPTHSFLLVAKGENPVWSDLTRAFLVRDGARTTVTFTMKLDGRAHDVAIVLPVPSGTSAEDVRAVDGSLLRRANSFSSIRLEKDLTTRGAREGRSVVGSGLDESQLEYRLPLGGLILEIDYDIQILKPSESRKLATWLEERGYAVDGKVSGLAEDYVERGLVFLVAEGHIPSGAFDAEEAKGFFTQPLQVTMNEPSWHVPLRLSMAGARDIGGLTLYALTPETESHIEGAKKVDVPTKLSIPEYVAENLTRFERDLLDRQANRNFPTSSMKIFLSDLDLRREDTEVPAENQPFMADELQALGVTWANPDLPRSNVAYVSRIELRSIPGTEVEDLALWDGRPGENFHILYKLNDWWGVKSDSTEAIKNRSIYRQQQRADAANLEYLTGYDLGSILDERFPPEKTFEPMKQSSPGGGQSYSNPPQPNGVQSASVGSVNVSSPGSSSEEPGGLPMGVIAAAVGGFLVCALVVFMVSSRRKTGAASSASGQYRAAD